MSKATPTGDLDVTDSLAGNDRTVDLQSGAASSVQVARRSAAFKGRDLNGQVLAGRYTLVSELGCGGMGQVFEAMDWRRADLPEAKRHVAIKILHCNVTELPTLFANLRREFYCAQALSHPNIVKVYEMDRDGDLAFFTMELLKGELLSSVIDRARPQPLPRSYAWSVIRDVGAGLAHAHSREVVHGDLKPQNVMITSDGEVRILDFGASGVPTRRSERKAHALQRDLIPSVTPAYTCCELLDGQQTDPRDDLFSLACFSYELLSGQHPFQRHNSIEARELGILPERPSSLTHRQWRALQQGLAWQRENRAIGVGEWLAKLGIELGSQPLPSPFAEVESAATAWNSVNVRRAALGAGIVAGVGAFVAYSLAPLSGVVEGEQTPVAAQTVPAAYIPPASADRSPPAESGAMPGPEVRTLPVIARSNVTISAENVRVLPGEGFAEITLVRSAANRQTRFTWWTEGSSAKPGSDFVAQHRTPQSFSNGRRSTKLFVRILPNETRRDSGIFYVAIGKPDGVTSATLARAKVWILPRGRDMVASN